MKISSVFFTATIASAAIGVEAQGINYGSRTSLRGARYSRRASETEAPLEAPSAYCDSVACPNLYVPVAGAANVACFGAECTVDQCCSLFCSSFSCVGAPPIPDAGAILCENGVCTQQQCCDGAHGVSPTEEPDTPDGSCESYNCPAGFTRIDNASAEKCKHKPDEDTAVPEGDDFIDDDFEEAPSFNFAFDDDVFDGAFSYGFGYDSSGGYGWNPISDAGTGGGRRMLRPVVGKRAVDTDIFVSRMSTSQTSSEEDFCNTATCCRRLERTLWGLE